MRCFPWNTPSTVDPDDLNYWGNRRDTHVHIQPGEIDDGETAKISILGGVPLKEINTATNGRTISSAIMVPWGYLRIQAHGATADANAPSAGR